MKDLDIWKIAREVVIDLLGKKLFNFIKAVEKEHNIEKISPAS